jgi:hypothetical protein
MFRMRSLVLFLAAMSAHSQTSVQLSGTVKSATNNQVIAGATVLLKSQQRSAVTDSSGKFTISNTSSIRRQDAASIPPRREKLAEPVLTQEWVQAGKSRVYDFVGKTRETRPELIPHWTEFHSSLSKHMAVVDTLMVSKKGFRTAKVALETLQKTDLIITLADSSSSSSEGATLVPDPSWTCYMPEGIPPPSLGTLAFTIEFKIGAIHHVGLTKFGKRIQYDITGGTITGAQINGTVLTGGLDYDLELANGSKEIEQINILRANNIPILMRNAGVAPAGDPNARMVLDFEAPNSSSFTWLHTGKFAAIRKVDSVGKTIRMEVYDISKVTNPAEKIQIQDPANSTHQTWNCFTLTGSNGTTVFTENVTLGSSISIGATKRGSRNIIPITGGTTTGKVTGKILNGGADYQLGGLDARYTLAPNDGEFIIVRNCGSGGLVPVFEARVDGPYNFLNENKYLSSQPGVGGGGVSITFYEKK